MKIELYDTQRREKTALTPIDPKAVRLYVCGPTVYDFAHIGNARPAIVFDVLFRLLRHVYGPQQVVYARNITDVDDKINARAARDFPGLGLNEAIGRVTAGTARQYIDDVGALGCLEPTHQPRATEHVEGMVALIERLVARGFAYLAEGHALFSPSAMDASSGAQKYGSLSRRPFDEMIAGARVDVAPYKRDPMDFVLWKPSKPGEPGWPGPAGLEGLGRPGWHIECSAMSMAKLLEPFGGGLQCDSPEANVFDIHGGGIDLVFPHHENEIAQTCCALGAPRMANVFMHNGFLQVEGAKMSKSAGNFITMDDLLRKDVFGGRAWPGAVLRFAMLRTHYRQPIDWTLRSLEEAEATLRKFAEAMDSTAATTAPSAEMASALADDLNVAEAIAHLHALHRAVKDAGASPEARATAARQLAADLAFIGVDASAARHARTHAGERTSQIEALVELRLQARRSRDWKESDRLRDEIAALGVTLQDAKDGLTTWTLTP